MVGCRGKVLEATTSDELPSLCGKPKVLLKIVDGVKIRHSGAKAKPFRCCWGRLLAHGRAGGVFVVAVIVAYLHVV